MRNWSREGLPLVLVMIVSGFIVWISGLIFEGGYLPNRLNRDVQYYGERY